MDVEKLKNFLDKKVKEYERPTFINDDPISVPHQFTKKQDIEIAAFFAATFAWGIRKTIIQKTNELMQLMDNAPHAFCLGHTDLDLKRLLSFKHRTFNATDLLYFIGFFQHHYTTNKSLETAFHMHMQEDDETVENALIGFHHYFFSLEESPDRTKKHIATPERNSACKRINMFLRWMVRSNSSGVDFGLWENIRTRQLVCPVDLHVARVATRFNLLQKNQANWMSALELTARLKEFDPNDPVKYDFALFGLGVMEKFS